MLDAEVEMAVALALRRNWNESACDYVENCSDKDITLFLNVTIDLVIQIRRATKGPTRSELEGTIECNIRDDLKVIERLSDPREVTGWVEESRVHLRNMRSTLQYADEILTEIVNCARAGDRSTLILLFRRRIGEFKSCFSTNLENSVMIRTIYRKHFRAVDAAIDHVDEYLERISDFDCNILDVLDLLWKSLADRVHFGCG